MSSKKLSAFAMTNNPYCLKCKRRMQSRGTRGGSRRFKCKTCGAGCQDSYDPRAKTLSTRPKHVRQRRRRAARRLGERIRDIELRIQALNDGKAILEWESKIAPEYIYTYTRKRRLRNKWASKLPLPSPQLLAVIYMILSFIPLIVYPTVKTFYIMPEPWNIVYTGFVIVSALVLIGEALAFFRFGKISNPIV